MHAKFFGVTGMNNVKNDSMYPFIIGVPGSYIDVSVYDDE